MASGAPAGRIATVLCRAVTELEAPIIIEDVHDDPRLADLNGIAEAPHQWYAAVPIGAGERNDSVLCLAGDAPCPFDDATTQQLIDLAALTAEAGTGHSAPSVPVADDLLLSNPALLSGIIDSAMDAIITIDEAQEVVLFNNAAETLFGCTAADAIGRSLGEFLPEDARADHAEHVRQFGRTGTTSRTMGALGAVRGRRINGDLFPAEASISAVKQGGKRYYTVIMRDISARQEAERALQESEARWRNFIEHSPSPILISKQGLIKYANAKAASVLGEASAADVIGRSVYDYMAPDLKKIHHARIAQVEEGVATEWLEHPVIQPDGTQRIVVTQSVPITFNGETLVQSVMRDVTEQHATRRALQKSRAHYQLVVDTVQEVVFQTDMEGRWTYLNPAWTELTGFGVDESLGRHFLDFVDPEDRSANLKVFRPLVEGEKNQCRHEVRYRTKSGGSVWVEVHAQLYSDAAGDPAGTGGTLTNVTGRRQREAELHAAKEEAEKMNRLKSAFLANMSHEIRTPLTSIIGFAELIDEDPEVAGTFAGSIRRSGHRLLRTLNSVLDLAQIESNEYRVLLEPVDVVAEAESALDTMRYQADARGLTLTTDWPETPVRVRADEAALQRICDNLLSNAVKFTSEGGIHVSVTPQGETVALVIEDTGIGMEEAFQEEMFEAFTQASTGNARTHEGSGLGLTITKELVERMDGDIAIQSAPGEGTTVTVTLPAAE